MSCGVWTDGHGFQAIETYPAACAKSAEISGLLTGAVDLGHQDKNDARICALVAHLFATERHTLEAPTADVPTSEGWIWLPKRAVAGHG